MPTAPLVTVLVAVHDGEPYVDAALRSVLRQSITDLELLVVDDGSTDGTPGTLATIGDDRLRVLRNDERVGLAASLNRGLEMARGRYVARMDADDVAFPGWLERTLGLLESRSALGIVGAGVLDLDARGRPGSVHVLEGSPAALRWRALFSSPFFHATVVLVRDLLERHGLRYDETFGESEDYELWTRVLRVSECAAVEAPLVLHRLHARQASRRRADLQRSHARDVSLAEIRGVAPELGELRAELARAVGLAASVPPDEARDAAHAFLELLAGFEHAHGLRGAERRAVREIAARSLARLVPAAGAGSPGILRNALALDRLLPLRAAGRRARRRRITRDARREAVELLRAVSRGDQPTPIAVAAVFPEPTPYRAPLLDRVAGRPEVDLTVLYAARTVAARTWEVHPLHRAVYLRGAALPGARRILRHEYPVTPGIDRALREARPDVVVVSGWSTFAAQAAIAWCRARHVPYVLVVESHDVDPRPGWRRAVKGFVVPRVVRGASSVLVTGTLARRSMVARGAHPERVRVFANTIDVDAFGERAEGLAASRTGFRERLGASTDDVVVLSVARLAREKGHDVLLRAVDAAADERLLLVVAGDGPERARLEGLAEELGARASFVGDVSWERVVELYVAADVFALLSRAEPWGVVVNEAAACGLPLVLSDRVGAAHDLLRDGENGVLVPAGDVGAAAEALRRLAADPDLRAAYGSGSRRIVADWGYDPSVEGLLAAVREAVGRGGGP